MSWITIKQLPLIFKSTKSTTWIPYRGHVTPSPTLQSLSLLLFSKKNPFQKNSCSTPLERNLLPFCIHQLRAPSWVSCRNGFTRRCSMMRPRVRTTWLNQLTTSPKYTWGPKRRTRFVERGTQGRVVSQSIGATCFKIIISGQPLMICGVKYTQEILRKVGSI